MTRRITLEQLVELVDNDGELVSVLVRERVVESREGGFQLEDVDRVLAARTLIREFDVNLPGVDIILRLRQHLAQARRRLQELENDPRIP